ncbi:hypothetical protein ACFX1X_038802 [Malus domestica]
MDLEYWDPTTLFEMASGIGTPIMIDLATLNKSVGLYARVLIDMDHSINPSFEILMECAHGDYLLVSLEFEKFPCICLAATILDITSRIVELNKGKTFHHKGVVDQGLAVNISEKGCVDPISFPTMVVVPGQSDLNNSASVVDVGNMTLTTEVTPIMDVSTSILDQVVNNATLVMNVNFFTSGMDNMTSCKSIS